ncbi:MAG: hypothetical protein ILP14_03845 [Oscillospiraceae bacterium]|nr:hypothetical protein [Oscillospiraceae bacterium]
MKFRLLFLLCTAMFLSLLPVPTLAETVSADENFFDAVEDQAFSIAVAYWQEGIDSSYTTIGEKVYWEAVGWYAAKQSRTSGRELISSSEVEEFLDSVGYKGEMNIPQLWEEYGIVKTVHGAGGFVFYDFTRNKAIFEARIGIDAEVEVKPENHNSTLVMITIHTPTADKLMCYRVAFSPNENRNSRFRYCVTYVEPFIPKPIIDEKLGFTWEQLLEKNKLSNILDRYPCVVISTPFISSYSCTSLFRHNGKYVWVSDNYGNLYGEYDRFSFDYRPYSDGKDRACIGSFDSTPAFEESVFENYIVNYLDGIDYVEAYGMDDNRIWLDYATGYGTTERYVIERDTLILCEIQAVPEGEDAWAMYEFNYTQDIPDYDFLNGWNGNLRTVTAVWEDVDRINGGYSYRTETLYLPMNWEYLPYIVQSGDYTAYLNPRYSGTYVYPGDNMDYTVFFKAEEG